MAIENIIIDRDNYLDLLFTSDESVIAENLAEMARRAEIEAAAKKEDAARVAARALSPSCPRCAGKGHLPQFSHRKGGECYGCGGTGLFTRF